MIYLIFIIVLVFLILFMLRKRHFGVKVISQSEYESYFNSLSDEEKLRKLRHQLKFREKSINRWPDDKEYREKNFETYGKETNPHQDIEKASIDRIKKEIEEIERIIKK